MRACIIVENYPSPGQTFVNRHIEHLFGGHTSVVATHKCENTTGERPILGLQQFRQRRSVASKLYDLKHYAQYGSKTIPYGAEKAALLKFWKDHGTEFVLAEFGPQGVSIAPIAAEAGLPMFCYFRGSDASSRIRHAHVQRAYRKMTPQLDGVFAVSQFLLDNLASVGVRHENSHVIPSGVDVRRFYPAEKTRGSVVFIGRFVEKKHPLLTIRAFAKATQNIPHAHLTMIGDGALLPAAQDFVSQLGIPKKVQFLGALPHAQVRSYLQKSEIYLQHSVTAANGNTEGLPTAIQEAMASGCVTVSTRHAGIPEAIEEGATGYLVDEYDEMEFAAALRKALTLPQGEITEMAKRARSVAEEKFDNGLLLEQLEKVITSAIAKH